MTSAIALLDGEEFVAGVFRREKKRKTVELFIGMLLDAHMFAVTVSGRMCSSVFQTSISVCRSEHLNYDGIKCSPLQYFPLRISKATYVRTTWFFRT